MQVDIVIEQRFYRCLKGYYWTENMFPYAFWLRYLRVFSQVNIVARVAKVKTAETAWHRVDGDQVGFVELPSYIGPIGFVKTLPGLYSVLRKRRHASRSVIFRIPGILAAIYQLLALPKDAKFGAEVVGDPADVFAKGASKSPLRVVFKSLFSTMLKHQCQQAISIAYVTEHKLQKRYPPNPIAMHTHYSSIQLTDVDYTKRQMYSFHEPLRIVCVGNLAQPYKGCDFMLQGIARLSAQGVDVSLTWIGGGSLLPSMKAFARGLGISSKVAFLGNVASREEIRQVLDSADLFILSSRQEGLPRVLIEAMARSLICVATDVGGVDELLEPRFILPRDDMDALIQRVTLVSGLSVEERLVESKRNFDTAQKYHNQQLQIRRDMMYQAVLEASPC
ncbi:Mannosylfructose-phosphate synthase [Paraglaciecola mesophila]|uniref:Mannosylfructose-phosphate synthase n=1 Tax=Paraglaciecola mesophila TaxID=197222 RepID=A0A857JL96_9ALTE|nr:glycosyltransferase [Paraglaciecola mesophila]QHJ12068.1 Mannosylfructose-phosphate synthase [Paraglaciecola mesophila]